MVYVLSTWNRRFGLVAVHAWYWRFASHGLRVRLAPLDNCVAASIPILVSAPPLATKHHYLHFEAVSSSIDSNPDQDMNSFTIPQPKNSKSVSNHHHFRKCADSFVPHIFVWGSCFWFCIPPSVRLLPSSLVLTQLVHTQLTHTQLAHTHNLSTHKLLTHNLSTHNLLTHNLSSHNLLTHNLLTHNLPTHNFHNLSTQNLLTHNLLTHNLSTHKLLTHNLSTHNLLTHNLSSHNLRTHNLLTHNLSTHNLLTHNLSSHNLSSNNLLSHNLLTQNLSTHNLSSHNWRSLCVAGVALTALGRLWWRTGFPNDAVDAGSLRGGRGTWRHRPSLCVAGVALTALGRLWWRTGFPSIFTLRGTWWHGPSLCVAGVALTALCVAGVALGDIDCHFAWQAWHLATCIFTWWHRRSLCVAGVALTALGRLWWRTGFPNYAVDAAALCVAGVALGDIDRHFAWQAWRLVTSAITLHGRRGTWRHVSSLGDIDAHFAWQAWHLRHWAGSGGAPGSNDATNGASGRLLTFLAVSLCVFKCRNIHCHFHGSSGANAFASFWRTQQNSAEVSFVANMMQRTELRTDCSRFWLFLCVCSNAATSIAISMAHQVQMLSLHFDRRSRFACRFVTL